MNLIYNMKQKLNIRLLAALAIYSAVCFTCVILLQSTSVNSNNELWLWILARWDIIFFLFLAIGYCAIFFYYGQKPWNYLDEVLSATNSVYKQDSKNIVLSEPLREVENQMNQIKMSALISNQAVMQAEKKKNELVMYLAHDIRTPLTTLIGYLSLLHEAPEMPPEQRAKFTNIALEKSEHLVMLINELFEISRYNTQAVMLNKTPVDVHFLLSQLIDEFYPILSKNKNTVTLDVNGPHTVSADSEKIARVFANLLKNAASYSDSETNIAISAKNEGGYLVVRIRNEGAAIPEEEFNTLFDPYVRTDRSRVSETGGAGLGLAIAKEIVVSHGGTIAAECDKHSITFIVKLPLSS